MPPRARSAILALVVLAAGAAGYLEWVDARRPPPRAAARPDTVATGGSGLTVVTPAGTRQFTLQQLRGALPVDTVSVRHDPSYEGRPKRYAGFALDRVLALAGLQPSPDEVLYFQASDGFRAILAEPVSVPGVRGVIAFADLDARSGWEPVGHAGKSPAPFYLVWAASDSIAAASTDPALGRPWPYQLVRIEAVDPRTKYARIFPVGVPQSDPVYRGYRAFVIQTRVGDQCIACHSLNLQGGTVGPELNVPRNVTEYRDDATLRAFIRDPRSFRARSPMPAFDLTDQEISDILAYLRWLRDRKVEVPPTS